MTTNYQRALATAVHCDLVDESPRELIKQLHDLGLIAPDLPTHVRENYSIPGVLIAAADHTEGNQK